MKNRNGFVKRPFALIGISFFLTVWSLAMFRMSFIAVILPILFSAVLLTMILKYKMQAAVLVMTFITVSSACFCFFMFEKNCSEAKRYIGEDVKVVGTVTEIHSYYNGSKCIIESEKIGSENVKEKLVVSFYNIRGNKLSIFDKISFRGKFSSVENPDNQYERYYKSKNIFLSGTSNDKQVNVISSVDHGLKYRIYKIRQEICDAVRSFLPNDNGELILSFFLGEKDGLSDKAEADFKICGISHLMAVSGLHMTIWTGIVFSFFVLFLSKRKAAVFSIAFTVFFMALTGFSPSVVRAGTLMTVVYCGYIFLKPADTLNSLGLAITLLCLENPYASCDTGLLLSFSVALGLSLFTSKIYSKKIDIFKKEYKNKILLSLYRTVMISLTATVFTFPVVVFTIGAVSLLSIPGNIVSIEISMLIMVLGGIGAVLTAIRFTGIIGQPILIVAAFLSKLLLKIVSVLAKADFMYIDIDNSYVRVCVVTMLLASLIIYIFKPDIYKNKKLTAFIAVNVILVSILGKFLISQMTGVV